MGLPVVDRIITQISYSGGNKELDTVTSMTVSESDPKAEVETMNRKRVPIGYTRGVQKTSADMEVVVPQGAPDVDWRGLKVRGELFLLTYEEEGGNRFSLVDAVVDEISTPYTKDGETRRSVKLKALEHRPEPGNAE
jgi:hypothetical protein